MLESDRLRENRLPLRQTFARFRSPGKAVEAIGELDAQFDIIGSVELQVELAAEWEAQSAANELSS